MHEQKGQSIQKTIKCNTFRANSNAFQKRNEIIIEQLKLKSNSSEKEKLRKYIKGKLLGKGGFAKCYELICKENNKVFAAKMISRSSITTERLRQKLLSEIKIHKSLHHQHIVSFEHVFEDNKNVYILLELCQNQTLNELFERRKRLTEVEVQCYMIHLIKALQYLHSHRVIHRDLKLGNLFLNDKMELKVGDFGLATKLDFEGERKKTVCGTPNYIAPEVLYATGHSYEVDIWAIGVIIYTLLIGKPPFETKEVKTTYTKIKKAEFSFPPNCKISLAAKNLIKKILILDPKKRPSLKDILADDFFNQGIGIPKLLPLTTLALEPPIEYIKKYIPNIGEDGIVQKENSFTQKKDTNILNLKTINPNDDNKNENVIITYKNKDINDNKIDKKKVKIIKWVDYSNKYGLGYKLSNGQIGVYFNDTTKMILNTDKKEFTYIDKKISEEFELLYTFSINEYPIDLKNKVDLFIQFKNYIEEENSKSKKDESNSKSKDNEESEEKKSPERHRHRHKKKKESKKSDEDDQNVNASMKTIDEIDFIFVKKWIKTRHAIIFRLSNKSIQVCFKDKTEIILNVVNENVTYINKQGEEIIYSINKALNSSNYEMNKRVKYTKDVLSYMVSTNKKKKEINEANSKDNDIK